MKLRSYKIKYYCGPSYRGIVERTEHICDSKKEAEEWVACRNIKSTSRRHTFKKVRHYGE